LLASLQIGIYHDIYWNGQVLLDSWFAPGSGLKPGSMILIETMRPIEYMLFFKSRQFVDFAHAFHAERGYQFGFAFDYHGLTTVNLRRHGLPASMSHFILLPFAQNFRGYP